MLAAFGRYIREMRTALGASQEQIAEYVGVSTQAVRDWEAGRHQPTVHHLQRLVNFLGITMEEALGRLPKIVYPSETSRVAVPISGYLMAGEEEHPPTFQLGSLNLPESIRQEHSPKVFGLIVKGDSLSVDGIQDGDIVLVDPDASLTEGSIEVVRIGGRLFPRVIPARPEASGKESLAGGVESLGRVIWHLRRL